MVPLKRVAIIAVLGFVAIIAIGAGSWAADDEAGDIKASLAMAVLINVGRRRLSDAR